MEAISRPGEVVRTYSPNAALADLYDAHAGAAYRLLLAMLGSPADAQDALGEIFLKLAGKDLRRLRNPRAYLLAAARNQAIHLLRRRQQELPADPDGPCFFAAASLNPEQGLLARLVETALRQLPAEQREVVVLKVYEDLTFAEIADITHTRPNTAASRYRYAIEKLRHLLGEKD